MRTLPNLHQLTHEVGACVHPSWSPDGQRLAFSCETTPDVCRRYFGGGGIGQRLMTETEACKWRLFIISPDASPSALVPLIQHDARAQLSLRNSRSSSRRLRDKLSATAKLGIISATIPISLRRKVRPRGSTPSPSSPPRPDSKTKTHSDHSSRP